MWNNFERKKIWANTISLYLFNITKMILPLMILPYLTRILSKEAYGVITYVKAVMQYMQLMIDYGFLVYGTKSIVEVKGNNLDLCQENSKIFTARLILGVFAGSVTVLSVFFMPILQDYKVYTLLSFVPIFLSVFLFDYLFRGLEKMHVITSRYVLMKLISTVLTFKYVKSNSDILLMPIFDIMGSLVAISLVFLELKKNNIRINLAKVKCAIAKIKEATLYFVSDIATTAFNALNTLIIGICMDKTQLANWSVCVQMIGAVQALYSPIMNGIYPTMLREKSARLIKRVLIVFLPIVLFGCLFILVAAEWIVVLVAGIRYLSAASTLRNLIPVLIFSFPAMLYGWPALGAINKIKEVTVSTIIAAVVQILGVSLLVIGGQMSLVSLAVTRSISEMSLFAIRFSLYNRYKKLFINCNIDN